MVAPRENIGLNLRPFDSTRRTIFGEFGCQIYGYPSTGGVIIRLNADLVELKQLNFDPLNPHPTRSSDQRDCTLAGEARDRRSACSPSRPAPAASPIGALTFLVSVNQLKIKSKTSGQSTKLLYTAWEKVRTG